MPSFCSRLIVILPFIALLTPEPVVAGVYKWVDENGRVHFGDRPPGQGNSETVTIRPAPRTTPSASTDSASPAANPVASADRIRSYADQLQEERLAREEARAEQQQADAERRAACQQLAARIRNMERISVFYNLDESGEREYLSDAEGDAHRERIRQRYARHCDA